MSSSSRASLVRVWACVGGVPSRAHCGGGGAAVAGLKKAVEEAGRRRGTNGFVFRSEVKSDVGDEPECRGSKAASADKGADALPMSS